MNATSATSNNSMNRQRNRRPRRISCGPGLDRIDPPMFLTRPQLIDYRAARADTETQTYEIGCKLRTASQHERRKTMIRERQEEQQRQRRRRQEPESVRSSLVARVPPTARQHQESQQQQSQDLEDDSSESDVVFVMKVTKPARLFRRRRTLHTSTNSACSTVGFANKQNRSAGTVSLFDESMTLYSMAALLPDDDDDNTEALDHDPADTSNPELPAQLAELQEEEDDVVAAAAAAVHPSAEFTCMAVANHDSFQTNATSDGDAAAPRRKQRANVVDLRKKRKTMMNWLANQIPSRDLMAPPDMEDPKPPLFVKVIYLGPAAEDEETSKGDSTNDNHTCNDSKEDVLQAWMETKLEETGSVHSHRSILDSSQHRKVAPSMA